MPFGGALASRSLAILSNKSFVRRDSAKTCDWKSACWSLSAWAPLTWRAKPPKGNGGLGRRCRKTYPRQSLELRGETSWPMPQTRCESPAVVRQGELGARDRSRRRGLRCLWHGPPYWLRLLMWLSPEEPASRRRRPGTRPRRFPRRRQLQGLCTGWYCCSPGRASRQRQFPLGEDLNHPPRPRLSSKPRQELKKSTSSGAPVVAGGTLSVIIYQASTSQRHDDHPVREV